jgi:Mannose-6-phosphate isomerase
VQQGGTRAVPISLAELIIPGPSIFVKVLKSFKTYNTREVGEGDGIAILPGQNHKIWNIGDEELVFLCCCSPSYEDEDTVLSQ